MAKKRHVFSTKTSACPAFPLKKIPYRPDGCFSWWVGSGYVTTGMQKARKKMSH